VLIQHQLWLNRRDFVNNNVDTDNATVNWAEAIAALNAGHLQCSSSAGQLLRIASSIAEGNPIDLYPATTSLDATNTALVANAICHAAGHRP
jgi:hypothetical protein